MCIYQTLHSSIIMGLTTVPSALLWLQWLMPQPYTMIDLYNMLYNLPVFLLRLLNVEVLSPPLSVSQMHRVLFHDGMRRPPASEPF